MEERIFSRGNPLFLRGNPADVMKGIHFLLRNPKESKFFKFKVSEMPSPAFFAGHKDDNNKDEGKVAVISCLFYPWAISGVISKVRCLRQKRVKQ